MKSHLIMLLGYLYTNLSFSYTDLNLYSESENTNQQINYNQEVYLRFSKDQGKHYKVAFNSLKNRNKKSKVISKTDLKLSINIYYPDSNFNPYLANDTIGFGIIDDIDVKAYFSGGQEKFIEYFTTAFEYPIRCQDDNIDGFIKLKFVVDEIGRISRVSAIEENANCPEFTTEAIRVLKKSPQWIPGQLKGIPVKSWNEITIELTVSKWNMRKKMRNSNYKSGT